MSFQKHIGRRIRGGLTASCLTPKEFAEKTGISESDIFDIENGSREVSHDELVVISEVLNRNIDYFVDPFAVEDEVRFHITVNRSNRPHK